VSTVDEGGDDMADDRLIDSFRATDHNGLILAPSAHASNISGRPPSVSFRALTSTGIARRSLAIDRISAADLVAFADFLRVSRVGDDLRRSRTRRRACPARR